ncbi:putative bacterial type II secretion system protein [Methanocella paludicola SANAE]|uniref:Bacterial type II secretion system protein n=1 Tax=Methanocella paludicola (strain DSM 17711 / JCM 13418 / NBRC 101707 / SANAE) TaxID=304371 RepID=D1Z1S2_METPS|nr:type II/IV secretion system ATPase subunit [Methanocella paludicola]BAI62644.1 putative bacterial type II secretion system protein [Methanocella paludicola SANAE]
MSLARDALLGVDDDGPKKSLLTGMIDRSEAGPADAEEPVPAAGGIEVVKSYRIDDNCSVQILWDPGSGKCRYDLIEPSITGDECKIYEAIVAELHKKPRSELETMKKSGGRERIRQKFERLCRERNVPATLKEKMRYFIERDFRGYKKIDALLKDENVEDVSCNGYGSPVYVYVPEYESIPTGISFGSEEELDDFILYLVQKGGKSISAAHPIQDVSLPDGSRLNGTIYREVSSNGSTFSIRVANRTRRAAELLRQRTFSPESLAFLWLAMENRCSMAFIGGTASGKTAALNAVVGSITDRHKIVTIEDTREVRLASQNWTPLVVRESGESPITEFELLLAAFRQRPEYVIVGEVRTPEGARAAIHGINSGHTVLMTFHADSASSFFNRVMNAPFNIPPHTAASLSLCVNLAMVSIQSGPVDVKVRRCRSISEIGGVNEDGTLMIRELFEWDPAGDSISMTAPRSSVLDRIKRDRGWDDGRLVEELSSRASVLRWIGENCVVDESRVKKIVESFHRDRKGLLRFMKKHSSFEGDIALGDFSYD